MTPHTSGAADLPDATASLIERLEDAVYEWGNYVDADHAPCPLTRHVDPHIKAIRAELERLHAESTRLSGLCDKWNSECDEFREDNKRLAALAAGQAVAPAEPTPDELRAIAREARNSSGSASDDCGSAMYVLYGWRAAMSNAATRPAPPAMDGGEDAKLSAIKQAIRDYHYALDTRQHGGIAISNAFENICTAMGMHWHQGIEAAARAAQKEGS